MQMQVLLSEGEILDRLSILELKRAKITDPMRLHEVDKELLLYHPIMHVKQKYILYYTLLFHVNQWIWEMTDIIKEHTALDETYATRSYRIFEWNQSRFRIKAILNHLAKADIHEQKSYSKMIIHTVLPKELPFIDQFCFLCYAVLSYDDVFITIQSEQDQWIYSLFPSIHRDTIPSIENSIVHLQLPLQMIDRLRTIYESLSMQDTIQAIQSTFHGCDELLYLVK